MSDEPSGETRAEAQRHFQQGYEAQMQGRLEEAVAHYQRSIALHPTAEAHTFLGWAYSHLGRPADAIAQCKIAISVDPDFGNPYNDIGAYLIELGREEEAVAWLERAKQAARYEPRHYPYFNRARIHIKRHEVRQAITELERAIELEPRYVTARQELHRLRGLLN
ncbi:MAG: tetratricopeptide repeat protein [Candidatus Rokuibacteriota bacterium]